MFGTTSEQLGAIAISQRKWAQMNPWAQMRKPLTMQEYLNSRYIAEPLHLFDCCLVSNGGVAVIVTSAEQARNLKQPPVYILGLGQASPGGTGRADPHQYGQRGHNLRHRCPAICGGRRGNEGHRPLYGNHPRA